jgi:hypothetical protein
MFVRENNEAHFILLATGTKGNQENIDFVAMDSYWARVFKIVRNFILVAIHSSTACLHAIKLFLS